MAADAARPIGAIYGRRPRRKRNLTFLRSGATLGGNATLLGAGSNIIAGGIASRAGRQISFVTFMRYGLPITLVQLFVSAIYLWFRFL